MSAKATRLVTLAAVLLGASFYGWLATVAWHSHQWPGGHDWGDFCGYLALILVVGWLAGA